MGDRTRRSRWRIGVLFGLAFALVVGVGIWVYVAQKRHVHDAAIARLSAIAQLKARELSSWRRERIGDGSVLAANAPFARTAERWLATQGAADEEQILETLRALETTFGYDEAALVDARGEVRAVAGTSGGALDPEVRVALDAAIRERRTTFADFHASTPSEAIHAEIVAPISVTDAPNAPVVGAVVLRSNAATSLFPIIQAWPAPDASGEIVIARRDGNAAILFGPLRFRARGAPMLREPLEGVPLPAVQAVRGVRGAIDARDYRGVEVLAYAVDVPNSPWLLLAKIDVAEEYAALRTRAALILVATLTALGALVGLAVSLFQRNEKAHFRALYASESARRQAEERYRAELERGAAERAKLEAHIAEAKRIESIGRLAGGVAHDFNNLLAIIIANIELVLADMKPDDPLRDDLREVRKAADRAASLTRQLLAFGRKQVLRPRVLNLNGVIEDVRRLLKSALGDSVALELELATDLERVRADRTQIEQVLMNLAINARDAMPAGGKLTIRTANARVDRPAHERLALADGDYVVLEVTDTGCGIDSATRVHLFEPFFTTKPIGKGTGLGLATVHGIVSQSGGAITVESSPGHGASFEIYLPIATEEGAESGTSRAAPQSPLASARVLLVEDEPAVRAVVERVLVAAGCEVASAASGEAALAVAERASRTFDVLLTDLSMPGMGGAALADRLAQRWPELCIVLMSGDADGALDPSHPLPKGARVVGKPFAPDALIEILRTMLECRPANGAGLEPRSA